MKNKTMKYILTIIFLFITSTVFSMSGDSSLYIGKKSPYVKKYCIAYNTFYSGITKDNSLYAYTNIYNNKHDFFVYGNYFDRTHAENGKMKDLSWGFFYDFAFSKKAFIWSFYQGEMLFGNPWNAQQLAGGLGIYLMNNDRCYITMNNGVLYKGITNEYLSFKNEYRYVLRFKSRLILGNTYFETYNYFQPSFSSPNDMNFITFNTATMKVYKNFNIKIYHWLSTNTIDNSSKFQYFILGFSIENWK